MNLLKLNPNIFSEDVKNDGVYGELGLPGILRFFRFEKIKEYEDQIRGKMTEVKLIVPVDFYEKTGMRIEKYEGSLIILSKDLMEEV